MLEISNESHKIKVIVTDLDGTLLTPEHTISTYTQSIFRALHRQGYSIIVATGRHHKDAMHITKSLDVPIYLVTSNGARIHTPEKELYYAFDIENEAIKSVLALDIDTAITTVLFKEEVWLTNKENKKLNSFQTEMHYPPQIVDFKTETDLSAIKLLFVDDDHEKLQQLDQLIKAQPHNYFETCFSLPICLELMDKRIDKSYAIAKILEKENYTFEEAISFGDGFNDEKMLLATQKALIMGNAPDKLKNKLAHLEVIASNDEDGVAKYIETNILHKVAK
ncbi:Cof-type HAD-IIB family hydrolase [Flavobacterium jejuense]|uniref:Cof-type HAD-IIB family hydrolase n=1 Tax=Flavobacterium jejuense TaxID=1544455 RepID=A0ABX0INY2_9FLAO|nr:Cof-type HAD-IIB family hydrolase [Flavobacterium jejuense]NHN24946.1 Cof-type HAD-IIB family hydrolase [Flavobacterium jejuense]